MRIIDVGNERYQVVSQIDSQNQDFIDRLSEMYKDRYNDFFLLKAQENPAVKPHHLICRKIDDAKYVELKKPKKKRQQKKSGWNTSTKGDI